MTLLREFLEKMIEELDYCPAYITYLLGDEFD
jgi:hypothetical protein